MNPKSSLLFNGCRQLLHLRGVAAQTRRQTRIRTASGKSTPVTEGLQKYLQDHTRELPPVSKTSLGDRGHAWCAEATGVQRAIEIGVFTGYSSLAVALVLPETGELYACDKDETSMSVARRYWCEAGVSHKIKECVGEASDTLQRLLDAGQAGTFDMAFIDANKRGYIKYYELSHKLVRPGGLIIADNVLFYGKVGDPAATDRYTQALRDFNDHILRDDRVSLSMVPIGDGMASAESGSEVESAFFASLGAGLAGEEAPWTQMAVKV
eukprot:CAMPEP_0177611028 /NCGR_PEP_ID=MMETSP0419_2-20121207/20202_1 /TAXON_ID=582737 /ORGANISM="Tetraselmis sp., Strain GSL018" /LENGTH=266 /DNA_ID=CAMNT_0019106589 /DNA_START=12 /DNA_END=812 /DNA_ORIENTATION=-